MSRKCTGHSVCLCSHNYDPNHSEYKKLRLNFLYGCSIYDYYCRIAWYRKGNRVTLFTFYFVRNDKVDSKVWR